MGQEFRSSLAGWFWLGVPHEVPLKCALGLQSREGLSGAGGFTSRMVPSQGCWSPQHCLSVLTAWCLTFSRPSDPRGQGTICKTFMTWSWKTHTIPFAVFSWSCRSFLNYRGRGHVWVWIPGGEDGWDPLWGGPCSQCCSPNSQERTQNGWDSRAQRPQGQRAARIWSQCYLIPNAMFFSIYRKRWTYGLFWCSYVSMFRNFFKTRKLFWMLSWKEVCAMGQLDGGLSSAYERPLYPVWNLAFYPGLSFKNISFLKLMGNLVSSSEETWENMDPNFTFFIDLKSWLCWILKRSNSLLGLKLHKLSASVISF